MIGSHNFFPPRKARIKSRFMLLGLVGCHFVLADAAPRAAICRRLECFSSPSNIDAAARACACTRKKHLHPSLPFHLLAILFNKLCWCDRRLNGPRTARRHATAGGRSLPGAEFAHGPEFQNLVRQVTGRGIRRGIHFWTGLA